LSAPKTSESGPATSSSLWPTATIHNAAPLQSHLNRMCHTHRAWTAAASASRIMSEPKHRMNGRDAGGRTAHRRHHRTAWHAGDHLLHVRVRAQRQLLRGHRV